MAVFHSFSLLPRYELFVHQPQFSFGLHICFSNSPVTFQTFPTLGLAVKSEALCVLMWDPCVSSLLLVTSFSHSGRKFITHPQGFSGDVHCSPLLPESSHPQILALQPKAYWRRLSGFLAVFIVFEFRGAVCHLPVLLLILV